MAKQYKSKLLFNVEDGRDHKSAITGLFEKARSFECMVAFAKMSAWKDFKTVLKTALARGMRARMGIGLDFYHTDPTLLIELWKIASKPGSLLELFVSDADETFHPKIYAFRYPNGCKLLVGSANFTKGGLSGNYEASILIDDATSEMMPSVTGHFDQLIDDEVLIPATKEVIDRYAYEHEVFTAAMRLAKRKAKNTVFSTGNSFYTLTEFLKMMREGSPNSRFDSDMAIRRETRATARTHLMEMAAWPNDPAQQFPQRYDALISAFHSGGLKRGKSFVAAFPAEFSAAVTEIVNNAEVEPRQAFEILLTHFKGIKGAGINLLTEILHSLDNERFAVMNQNSVSGLRIAGFQEFPPQPAKDNVSPDLYQLYCDRAKEVRNKLHLSSFTELDALFNFVYWHDERQEDEEEDDQG
ncbi:hypothetical protein LH128_31620 [Sphingomonas sp. LH128]|uniref:phospholipase D-like domain-containing protein n=1 Tax=Sphingomonas sp. LH128 TaxID=473781 RepID=UPI00027CA4B8|nr:phospholipase D family protein [Sphingomonas sp. LH128]EJU08944.1 hypothetical protein LH128_31620 [Sphingomonas sp. LH128]